MQQNSSKIGLATAVIIGMNAMIGSGIFTAPATLASYVGPAGIIAYLFVIVAVWFIAQSLARLAAIFPEEGSFYAYSKPWAGHMGGLFASGIYLVGLVIAMGLLCHAGGAYMHKLVPNVSSQMLGLILLISLVVLNLFGVVLSELGQQILILTTTFPLIATIIMCFSQAKLSNLTPFAPHGLLSAFKATRFVIFGFFGFEAAASLFNVVQNPARNVPRALTYSITLVGLLYILFVASIIISTPMHYFTHPFMPLSDVLAQLFPNNTWLIATIHLSILSAIIGTIHSMIWSAGALFVALTHTIRSAKKALTQRHAVILIGIGILITFFTLHNISLFFNLTALCIITAFMMSLITLLTIREEWQSGQNIKTILGMITASAIVYYAIEGIMETIKLTW